MSAPEVVGEGDSWRPFLSAYSHWHVTAAGIGSPLSLLDIGFGGVCGLWFPFVGFCSSQPVWRMCQTVLVLILLCGERSLARQFSAISSPAAPRTPGQLSALEQYLQSEGSFDAYENLKRFLLVLAYFCIMWIMADQRIKNVNLNGRSADVPEKSDMRSSGLPSPVTVPEIATLIVFYANVWEAGAFAVFQSDYVLGFLILAFAFPMEYLTVCPQTNTIRLKLTKTAGNALNLDRNGTGTKGQQLVGHQVQLQDKEKHSKQDDELKDNASRSSGATSSCSTSCIIRFNDAEYRAGLAMNRAHCALIGLWHFFGYRWRVRRRCLLPAMSCFMPLLLCELLHRYWSYRQGSSGALLRTKSATVSSTSQDTMLNLNAKASPRSRTFSSAPSLAAVPIPSVLAPTHVWAVLRLFALIPFSIYDTFFDHGFDKRAQQGLFPEGQFSHYESTVLRNGISLLAFVALHFTCGLVSGSAPTWECGNSSAWSQLKSLFLGATTLDVSNSTSFTGRFFANLHHGGRGRRGRPGSKNVYFKEKMG
ncbi:unnamed protein product [Amoebophrya sp. A120]|nr:unnamed protein product [Amoebophrya sp. A120]|eukprot:GSA120T00005083001.1